MYSYIPELFVREVNLFYFRGKLSSVFIVQLLNQLLQLSI